MQTAAPGTRICVIGNAGSGKTYLAQRLAKRLGLRYIDFDSTVLRPNWQRVPETERVDLFDVAARDGGWTIDGHLRANRPSEQLILARADTVIWLDFARWRVLASVIPRTLRNTVTRKRLWSGNIETWPMLLSRDHSILGAWHTHERLRDEYSRLFANPANTSRCLIRFHTRSAVNRWLADVCPRPEA